MCYRYYEVARESSLKPVISYHVIVLLIWNTYTISICFMSPIIFFFLLLVASRIVRFMVCDSVHCTLGMINGKTTPVAARPLQMNQRLHVARMDDAIRECNRLCGSVDVSFFLFCSVMHLLIAVMPYTLQHFPCGIAQRIRL